MKTSIILFFLSSLAMNSFSQNCDTQFYPMSTGNEFELSSYDAKEKLSSKTHYTVTNGHSTANGFEAHIKVDNYDDKDKLTGTNEMNISCTDNTYYVDMVMYLSPETMEGYEGMDVTISGDDLQYPSTLSVDQTLPDATMVVTVTNESMPIMTITMNITNRKVEAAENVIVPAGSFECIKMSYDAKVTIGNIFPIVTNMHAIEWIHFGSGMIRSESYKENGKLMGYTVLSMIKK